MKKVGDQMHDTLHQTRVRREVATNERAAYTEATSELLVALHARFEEAVTAAQANGQDVVPSFRKVEAGILEQYQESRKLLEALQLEDADTWYALRDQLDIKLDSLRQEVHTLVSISTP